MNPFRINSLQLSSKILEGSSEESPKALEEPRLIITVLPSLLILAGTIVPLVIFFHSDKSVLSYVFLSIVLIIHFSIGYFLHREIIRNEFAIIENLKALRKSQSPSEIEEVKEEVEVVTKEPSFLKAFDFGKTFFLGSHAFHPLHELRTPNRAIIFHPHLNSQENFKWEGKQLRFTIFQEIDSEGFKVKFSSGQSDTCIVDPTEDYGYNIADQSSVFPAYLEALSAKPESHEPILIFDCYDSSKKYPLSKHQLIYEDIQKPLIIIPASYPDSILGRLLSELINYSFQPEITAVIKKSGSYDVIKTWRKKPQIVSVSESIEETIKELINIETAYSTDDPPDKSA